MKIVEFSKKGFQRELNRITNRFQILDDSVRKKVEGILKEVRVQGDSALKKFEKKFDRVTLQPKQFKVPPIKIKKAHRHLTPDQMKSLRYAAQRIRFFHENQKVTSWSRRSGGALVGQIVRPLSCVGIYVPGGNAAYPSSVLMNAIPAHVAGVPRIVMCTPPSIKGINPSLLAAAKMAGVHEVFQIGGAQAIGAMAFGTRTIPKVDKIVGPGNIFVATAKRLVFGVVDIDMVAGPSEVLIIADTSASPAYVAADLLAQAEHDEKAASILVTPSLSLASAVQKEIQKQLKELSRRSIASVSIKAFGAIFVVRNLREAVDLANCVAPEHLELAVKKPRALLPGLKNAGAIFLGHFTTEPVGDYVAGPNHVLPTGGTARFFSPLCVEDFFKKTSLIEYGKAELGRAKEAILQLSALEGLEAHGKAVQIRL
ncbi:MAG TPA: histidinol dehydrogenase [Nitrospiria bacterium]|jgi:histidinol dehydrogenase